MDKKTIFEWLESGDGRWLLWRICESVEKSEYPDFQLLETHAKQLREIIEGVPPKEALGLLKKRGRKHKGVECLEIGKRVYLLRREKVGYDDAIALVMKESNLGRSRVEECFAFFNKVAGPE